MERGTKGTLRVAGAWGQLTVETKSRGVASSHEHKAGLFSIKAVWLTLEEGGVNHKPSSQNYRKAERGALNKQHTIGDCKIRFQSKG